MTRASTWRSLRLMVGIAFRADPWRTIVTLLPLSALSFTGSLIALRLLINAMSGGNRGTVPRSCSSPRRGPRSPLGSAR